MRPQRLFLTLVLTVLLAQFAAIPAARAQEPPGRDQRWREDLAVLAMELPVRHIDPFHAIAQDQFEAAIAALDAEIPALDDAQIILRLMQIVALLGDAHTGVVPPDYLGELVLPLSFYPFAGGTVLVSAPQEYAAALGLTLVRVGETDFATVLERLGTAIPHENPGWLRVQGAYYLTLPRALYALGLIPSTDGAKLTFAGVDGAEVTLDVRALAAGDLRGLSWRTALDPAAVPFTFQRQTPPNYWYARLRGAQTLVIAYAICADTPDWPFADFMAEVLSVLDGGDIHRVVIDLRNNTGGDSRVLEPLIAALAERPAINQRGGLFVLIGPRTYSSAVLNAI